MENQQHKLLPPPDTVKCKDCRQQLNPVNHEGVCADCEHQRRERDHTLEVRRKVQALDAKALQMLEELSSNPDMVTNLPHLSTFLEDLMTMWGGSQGLARHMMSEFLSARPGSQIRQRYLMILQRMIQEASARDYVMKPLDNMTDEELMEYQRQQQAMLRAKLGVIDTDGRRLPEPRSDSA